MGTALIEEPSFGAVLCAQVTEFASSTPHAAFACQVPFSVYQRLSAR